MDGGFPRRTANIANKMAASTTKEMAFVAFEAEFEQNG